MTGNSLFCLVFSLFLVFSVISAGCSDDPPATETATPSPAHPDPLYREGDIIATDSSSMSSTLYYIVKYDPATDQYTKAIIEKNTDGTWGHRSSDRTEKSSRVALEKKYTTRVAHVAVSIVPVITPATMTESVQPRSGNSPSIAKISPVSAARDTVVSVTITGSDFQNGATVKLVKVGSPSITATGVSATAFGISCLFNLHGKSDGSYNLIVINPDGQSDSLQGAFTIGDAHPIVAGIYPVTASLNDEVVVSITGQNFRNEIKVSFTKGSTELVCDEPLSLDSSRISCNLDLKVIRGASAGDWNVTVLNIRDQQKGTWIKKFVVTNATPAGN